MSKFLAYPFLYDEAADLNCDFEILTDEISSMIGLLRSLPDDEDKTADPDLAGDLSNLYSGYFFILALWFNKLHGEEERPFISRNY